jgi:Big-like domain-containing protein
MIRVIRMRWAAAVAAFFFMTAAAFAGVTVSSPAAGSTTGSPVNFVASATGTYPISSMRIYVDGVSTYTTYTASLNTSVAMATGGHSIVVQAWDTHGNVYKNPFSITVGSTTTSTTTLTSTTTSTTGVSVSSPGDGAAVGSPFQVVASASAANPISAMRIYLDGNSMYTVNSNQLNTSITAANGSHSLIVQAWDTTGAVYKQALTVSVGSTTTTTTTSTTPTSTSSAPSNATVISGIQTMSPWDSCTVCAGAGGNGTVATFGYTQGVASPSLSGTSMEFYLGGSTPYSDAIWWRQLGANNSATHFQYDLDFYLTNPQFAEALEFDVNQSIGNTKFIFGTQCGVISDGQWDVWDTLGGHWRPTGIPCAMPAAYQWHHLTWEFYRDNTYTYYVAVTLDGVKHYVNAQYQAKPWSANEINVAFQMDGDYAQHAYNAWLDNVTLRYW